MPLLVYIPEIKKQQQQELVIEHKSVHIPDAMKISKLKSTRFTRDKLQWCTNEKKIVQYMVDKLHAIISWQGFSQASTALITYIQRLQNWDSSSPPKVILTALWAGDAGHGYGDYQTIMDSNVPVVTEYFRQLERQRQLSASAAELNLIANKLFDILIKTELEPNDCLIVQDVLTDLPELAF